MKLSNTVGRWENPIKNGHMYIYIRKTITVTIHLSLVCRS